VAQQHNGLERLYEEVRAFVEARLGPGSLPEEKFNELCRLGESPFRHIEAERQPLGHPLLERLEVLEQRIEQLEAEVAILKARVKRLEARQ
jgi:uncharacterized protein YceH (UPF0502 family)